MATNGFPHLAGLSIQTKNKQLQLMLTMSKGLLRDNWLTFRAESYKMPVHRQGLKRWLMVDGCPKDPFGESSRLKAHGSWLQLPSFQS